MSLPIVYRKSTENSIASYDFIDTIEGLGYIKFYGTVLSGANVLLRNQIPSSPIKTQFNLGTGTAWTAYASKNWDLSFNLPAIVGNGPVFSVCGFDSYFAASDGRESHFEMEVVISKVSGGATTTLCTASGAVVCQGGGIQTSHRLGNQVTLPRTKLKAGDILRINTKICGKNVDIAGGTRTCHMWHDGAARNTTLYDQVNPDNIDADLDFKNATDFHVLIPFKLDL
jgi:hypothetical protein